MKRSPLTIIFLTVFIDLIGFGMIIPLNPYLAREYGASAFEAGLLLSVYSLMQILFSPVWGRWSDRIGRRPIILVSLVGTGLCHLSFAYSGSLWMLFVSRTLAGIFGANISTAMAYAADVTEDKNRSSAMGLVGAAIGLGFIFGPFFGGILGDIGLKMGEIPPLGHSFPALVAAALCIANAVFAYFRLPESLPVDKRANLPVRTSKIKAAMEHFSRPVTGPLLLVTFLASFSMTQMEATLFFLVKDKFDLGLSSASYAFAYVGVVIAFTQGFLIRRLLPLAGERKLMVWGTAVSGVALGVVGFSPSILILAVIMTAMALGFGLRTPALNGSISMACSAREQGAVMGVNQSLQALGRVLGPPLGGWLYGAFGAETNFAIAGVFGLAGLIVIWRVYPGIPDTFKEDAKKDSPPPPSSTTGMIDRNASRAFAESSKPLTPAPVAPVFGASSPPAAEVASQPISPVVIQERPRSGRLPEPPKVEHIRKEDRITFISAFQFRSLFASNVGFLFFDLRPPGSAPQYSRAVQTTDEGVLAELAKRTTDKRAPLLILCEDGVISKIVANKIADEGFINVVVVDGGAKALNRTGHV